MNTTVVGPVEPTERAKFAFVVRAASGYECAGEDSITLDQWRDINRILAGKKLAAAPQQQDDGPDVEDGHDWEGFPDGCERFNCPPDCAPPAQQQGEPVYQVKYDSEIGASFEDTDKETYDAHTGSKRILYTSPPSYDQGFAEAIEAAAAKVDAIRKRVPHYSLGLQEAHNAILALKPTTDTITMSREELRALIEEIEAIMKGEHGSDWADHFSTLFDRLYTVSRALEGK